MWVMLGVLVTGLDNYFYVFSVNRAKCISEPAFRSPDPGQRDKRMGREGKVEESKLSMSSHGGLWRLLAHE